MRIAASAIALLACILLACAASAPPAGAQQRNPDNSVNPTASAVKEQQLLEQMRIISGRGTIPDVKSYNIEQPAGRDWRVFHEITLHWLGGIAILGMLGLLVVFYLVPGMLGHLANLSLLDGAAWVALHYALATLAFALTIWGFVEIGCLRGTAGANRYGANPLTR